MGTTESKHTPGPWIAIEEDRGTCFRIKSEDWGGIAILHHPDARELGMLDVVEANANLIAAAPELLAACKEWAEVWMPGKKHEKSWQRLVGAIAKAEGGAA